MFGKRHTDLPDRDERPHPYEPGYGHTSYCQAILPSGIHCGRKEVDPIHVVDPRNPFRHRG